MRTAGLFTVCALVLGIGAFAASRGSQDNITFSDGTVCGLDGTARSAAGKALSRLKNRHSIPGQSDIKSMITLAAMLQPGYDATRFQSTAAATITGYVNDVKFGGEKEVCNCGMRQPNDRDTHIELGLSANSPPTERVIVEVTPRLRAMMKQGGVDWSTVTLQGQNPANPSGGIRHKWVEVTGWMMFDTMHVDQAENTNPGNSTNWRATCWEIHPVTRIRVLASPPPSPPGFSSLPAFSAATTRKRASYHAALRPSDRQQYRARNARLLARFPPEDRENDNR
jgi:hypothetical protein